MQSVTNATLDLKLQALTDAVATGFKGVHERQDTTNGKVLQSQQDITTIQQTIAVQLAVNKIKGRYEKAMWFVITTLVGVVVFFITKSL